MVTAIRSELLRRFQAGGEDSSAPILITPDSLSVPARVARHEEYWGDERSAGGDDRLAPR